MLIPYECLSQDSLNGLIEQYILQEHGLNGQIDPVTENRSVVLAALAEGKMTVVYSQINNLAWLAPRTDS